MLLYNVTITIDTDAAEDWLQWMQATHIPDVMVTGMFRSYRMSRLLSHEHEGAEIFTMQYLAESQAKLDEYQTRFAPELQRHVRERYEGKFAAFRTVMEVLSMSE
ncbi:MAG: DUF4286 family protein [Saprospiraceae bacterium]